MASITQLAAKYGSDKRQADHNYVEIYEQWLGNRHIESLLEIGLGSGASARMWTEYFSGAKIYAIELFGNENKEKWNSFSGEMPGLVVFSGSSTEASTWATVPQNLDVIIDDGSHHPDHQIQSFMLGFSKLKPGGLYIIEDTHCNFEHIYTGGKDVLYPWLMDLIVKQQVPKQGTVGDFYKAQRLIEGISSQIFSYHCYKSLIIFEKAR